MIKIKGLLIIVGGDSSHPKSFNFYKKIGTEIKKYTKKSDNGLYDRNCKSFLISIDGPKMSMANDT